MLQLRIDARLVALCAQTNAPLNRGDPFLLTRFCTLLESSATRHFKQASNVHCLLATPALVSAHAPLRQAPNLKSLTRLFLQASARAASPTGLEPGHDV
jgi:hypothetical protein